jgi:Cu-processing system permease protein
MLLELLKYQISNIFRNKWIFIYAGIFFILTESLYQFSTDSTKVFISLMNVILITLPLVSIIYGTQYVYNSREFTEVLLSQPIDRRKIFLSSYLASVIAISGAFIIGCGIPLTIHEIRNDLTYPLILLLTGGLLSSIFISIAFLIAYKYDDKAKGLGLSLILWFVLAILYDGIFLFIMFSLRDYPMEYPAIIMSIFNPTDLARLIFMLKLDISALMGYTGAIFKKFFGSYTGMIISSVSLIIWLFIPVLLSGKLFAKKDF